MGFLGSATLVDENSIRSEVEDNSERTVSPGESLNMGLLVDTRDSTISNPIPTALDDTITIYAEATGASGVGGGGGGNPSTQTGTDWNELRTKLDNDGDLTLQNDLDASTPGFQQVDPPKEYSGTLDGDGHEIRNITVNANGDDVGLFKQITSGGEVKNISFKDITINSDTSGRRNGFIGYIGPNCTLENVSAKNVTITGGSRTGFIGKIDSDVNNVQVENVNVEGTDRVGGLIGHNQFQSVENASVTGGTVTGDAAVGGLVGDNQEKINNSSVGATVVEGDTNIGGLVGINRGDGEIYRSYATGDVNGGSRVGGLAGSNQGSSGTVSITESYATGDVDGADLVGGIVGVSWGNPRAIVEKSYAIGDVNGSTGVGGLVGRDGPPSGSSAFNGDVEESYATGAVSGTSNVGGIIGEFFSGTVANVYWDQNTTGQTSSPGGGTDLTTSQMQGSTATQNMPGFDFSGTWTVVTNPDGYPILQWQ
jgi:hypothetical protein